MGSKRYYTEAWDCCVEVAEHGEGAGMLAASMLDNAECLLTADRDRRWRYCALAVATLLAIATLVLSTCGCAATPKLRSLDERASDVAFVEKWCLVGGDVWHGQLSGAGQAASGSLVVVGPHTAITAAHVVSCPGYLAMKARLPGGTHVDLSVLHVDVGLDVALVYSEAGFGDVAPPKVRAARVGEYACSHVAGPVAGRHCGTVIEARPGDGGITALVEGRHGNSGSGLYGLDGALLGIVVALDPDTKVTMLLLDGTADATEGSKSTALFGAHPEWFK